MYLSRFSTGPAGWGDLSTSKRSRSGSDQARVAELGRWAFPNLGYLFALFSLRLVINASDLLRIKDPCCDAKGDNS